MLVKKITKLKLANNGIGFDRLGIIEVLLKALEGNKTITELDLSGNKIHFSNIKVFESEILENTKIKVLTLNDLKFDSHKKNEPQESQSDYTPENEEKEK